MPDRDPRLKPPRSRLRGNLIAIAFALLVLYVVTAQVVLSFRHPWMTETEKLMHFFDAMTFSRVDYDEARPRDGN